VKEDKRGSMEGSRAPPTEPGSIVLSYFVSTDGSCVQLPVLSVSMEKRRGQVIYFLPGFLGYGINLPDPIFLPMAWGTYMLRSSFVLVFIRLLVKARENPFRFEMMYRIPGNPTTVNRVQQS
jgi:hypothetical protein